MINDNWKILCFQKGDDGKSDVKFWVCLYSDLNTLANKLDQFYKLASSRFGPKVSAHTQDLLCSK